MRNSKGTKPTHQNNKIMRPNKQGSFLTLNIYDHNSFKKTQNNRLDYKNRMHPSAASKKHILTSRRLRVKEQEKIFQATVPKKRAGISVVISDNIEFRPKLIIIQKVTAYSSKEKIYQEHISVLNINGTNTRMTKFLC